MKKLLGLVIISIFTIALTACDVEGVKDSPTSMNTQSDVQKNANRVELPQRVIEYVESNHPQAIITHFERDYDGYEVYLSSGQRVDFDFDGTIEKHYVAYYHRTYSEDNIIAFDGLPESIQNYVLVNYYNYSIRKIEYDEGMYEIEFTSGIELYFTRSGYLYYVDYD